MIPQLIVLILMAMNLGMALVKHGEPTNMKYNVLTSFLGNVITIGLLYWGGFFDVFWR